jgi:DNA-binding CsgD family transcriptional regulator
VLLGREHECRAIDRLLESARSGASAVAVVRGGPGMGKSTLLDYALKSSSGFRTARAAGVEAEVELAFASLQQLCAPLLDGLARLPRPQRVALETAFGLADGGPPDKFLVGLALLSLLSDAGSSQPLLCVVDDAQWLDRASAQALSFAARRLEADSVAVVFATRDISGTDELARFPELMLERLSGPDALELLTSTLQGRLDGTVATRVVAEAQGNPLALLELARASGPGDLAGGFALPGAAIPGQIEETFRRRAERLPPDTQFLLLLAAAEPVGDPAVLWRAATILQIEDDAASPAEDDGLIEFGTLVRFRHPLVRSALYKAASASQRRRAHGALADATDRKIDPDRRAWHQAQAAAGPDEALAEELERSADRAQARGGPAATAAFLERAVALSLDPALKVKRALAAAEAKYEAGAPDSALELLTFVDTGPADALSRARVERLRGRVAHLKGRGDESARLLLSAATHLEVLDPALAQETFLAALHAAIISGARDGLLAVASALPTTSRAREPRPVELLLSGWSRLISRGFPAGYDDLKRAMRALDSEPESGGADLRVLFFAIQVARACWDDEHWYLLSSRYVRQARDSGALTELPRALSVHGQFLEQSGEFAAAAGMFEEANAIAEATGAAPTWGSPYGSAVGDEEDLAIERIEAAYREASRTGDGDRMLTTQRALAVLYNGLGRYREAMAAAQRFCDQHPRGGTGKVLMELVEASSRCGEHDLAAEAFQRLRQRTQNGGTDWALGVEATAGALLSQGQAAEDLYGQALDRLGRCRMRIYQARTALLYGEWLRREHRPVDAREQLRTAYAMFETMGARAFARRAQTELAATGGRAPKSKRHLSDELTSQEARVAGLASEGLTNQQVAAQLFLSPNTVDYHLRKVFQKLNINTRGQLHRVLADHLGRAGRAPARPQLA